MQQSEEKYSSNQTRLLYKALLKRGVNAQLEYSDGHKTVDIAVLNAHLYIEVDGIQHFTNSEQIIRDFKRNHYSDGDDFSTFYVTNQLIDKYLDEIADALVKVISEKSG